MEAEAKYTYVGAAVIALVAALIASVVWLKRTGAERDFARYTIYFEQQALDGLAVGSGVNMRGISVGRVLDYHLSTDRLNRARVDVRLDRRAPVRANTSAVIVRNFVTGIAQIRLVTPEPAGDLLAEPPAGERYPVIAEGRSDVEELTGKVTELGEMAGDVMQRLNQLLTAENRAALAGTLSNLRDLTSDLKRQTNGLDKTIAEVGAAASEFRRAAEKVATTTDHIGKGSAAALGEAHALVVDLRAATAETQRSVATASNAIDGLKVEATRAARRVEATAATLDDQMLVAVSELRASLDTLQRSLDRINDPRTALLGPERSRLGPGEKLP